MLLLLTAPAQVSTAPPDAAAAGAGFHTAFDHQQVAVLNRELAHAIAADPHEDLSPRPKNPGGRGSASRIAKAAHRPPTQLNRPRLVTSFVPTISLSQYLNASDVE